MYKNSLWYIFNKRERLIAFITMYFTIPAQIFKDRNNGCIWKNPLKVNSRADF